MVLTVGSMGCLLYLKRLPVRLSVFLYDTSADCMTLMQFDISYISVKRADSLPVPEMLK